MPDLFKNRVIIITAPSGAGKTSITKYLLEKHPELSFSISAATRKARRDEVDGQSYYFMGPGEFQQKIQNDEFVEWEMVYEGKYYGTLRSELERIWKNDQIPVLDVDVKGAIHVQQQYPHTSLSIFIEPPSIEELERRLRGRGTESVESIASRVNKSAYEIAFKYHFNKIIVNDKLDRACEEASDSIERFMKQIRVKP